MKRKIKKINNVLFFIVVIIILIWACSYSMDVQVPLFSHESGFYEEDFKLTINVPKGYKVYYTLDGSIPNDESNIYESPIVITDIKDEVPLKYANIKNISGLEALGRNDNIFLSTDVIKRGQVIRARAKNSKGKWSEVITNTYFVGVDSEDYNNLPVIMLTIDPEDLFGEEGIYCNGKQYEELMKNYVVPSGSEAEKLLAAAELWKQANWCQIGAQWKKEADFQMLINQNLFDAKATAKINGGMSRIYSQKSFGINFLEDFKAPLIKGQESCSAIKLRQGGSQNLSGFLNDYVVSKLSDLSAFDTQEQQLCVLFLNGEYWGIYTICEKYTEEYFYINYGVDASRLIMFKGVGSPNPVLHIGREEDVQLYNDFMDYVEKTDFSQADKYNELLSKIDLDSYLQLYCTNIYFGNWDLVNHNIAFWTYYDEKEGRYEPWKWMMYDCDETFTIDKKTSDVIEAYRTYDTLFNKLMDNEIFREKAVLYFEELRNVKLTPHRFNEFIDETEDILLPIVSEYYNRFGPIEIANKPQEEQYMYFKRYMDDLRYFLQKRYDEGLEGIYYCFGKDLYDVKENDIVIEFGKNGNGEYFTGNGFYAPEAEWRYAQNNAEIFIKLAPCDGIVMDLSENGLAEDTVITFNGHVIWEWKDGLECLSNIIVPKDFIIENDENKIVFSTTADILSPKERGLSNDNRIMAYRMTKMKLGELEVYHIDEKDLIIDFTSDGNSDNFITDGFYGPEESGNWAQKDAEISLYLSTDTDLILDMSRNGLAEDAEVKFNGKTAWKSEDGIEKLGNIVIPKEWVLEDLKNTIHISTKSELLSPKERGISDDERILAHRMVQMHIRSIEQ